MFSFVIFSSFQKIKNPGDCRGFHAFMYIKITSDPTQKTPGRWSAAAAITDACVGKRCWHFCPLKFSVGQYDKKKETCQGGIKGLSEDRLDVRSGIITLSNVQ
jgi:hypothetical protein